MVAHAVRGGHGYRLTRQALLTRALFIGTLAAAALSGPCVSRFRLVQRSAASHGAVDPRSRDRSPAAAGDTR